EDIDLLLDSRGGLTFVATEDISERSLLRLLQKVDRSFQKASQTFRAMNQDGYLVDLIKPMRTPPWSGDQETVGSDSDDLTAAEIEGLAWHESAPPFESIAIDEKGEPLRIVATDPRVWAAHKLWLSKRQDRDAIKRRRDEAQARVVGHLVAKYLTYLEFIPEQMKMLPRSVFDDAKQLFV
ncbi:MAG: GSU2403 family nucleotidyltransferase fold protein, partial [Pseudolabrys sp.]